MQPEDIHSADDRSVSGRKVVIAMFALGIVATGILWTYWQLHLMPFMPLQEALVREFEDSRPHVEGGTRKIHKGTPSILRIVMRVPFDPTLEDAATETRLQSLFETTRTLAAQHTELEQYQEIEIHLYFEEKEQVLHQQSFRIDLSSPNADAVRFEYEATNRAATDSDADSVNDDADAEAADDSAAAGGE